MVSNHWGRWDASSYFIEFQGQEHQKKRTKKIAFCDCTKSYVVNKRYKRSHGVTQFVTCHVDTFYNSNSSSWLFLTPAIAGGSSWTQAVEVAPKVRLGARLSRSRAEPAATLPGFSALHITWFVDYKKLSWFSSQSISSNSYNPYVQLLRIIPIRSSLRLRRT